MVEVGAFAHTKRVTSSNGKKITVREYRNDVDFYIILYVNLSIRPVYAMLFENIIKVTFLFLFDCCQFLLQIQ